MQDSAEADSTTGQTSVPATVNTTSVAGTKNSNKKSAQQRHSENGFEEWGGYMAAKKAKLDVQFNSNVAESGVNNGIFKGISIHVNGYTNPPAPELREIFTKNGGLFHTYNGSRTTFVIATNLSAPSKNLYAAKTVRPEWITDSVAAGKKLEPRDYLLYNLNEENNQLTLTQIMKKKADPCAGVNVDNVKSQPSSSSSANRSNTNVDKTHDEDPQDGADRESDNDDDPSDFLEGSDDEERNSSSRRKSGKLQIPAPTKSSIGTKKHIKTATEDGFLQEFFKNSRLHLISDQKKEMQNRIGHMRKNTSHNFPLLDAFEKEEQSSKLNLEKFDGEVTLMHIDLDCFFVSVGLLSRPEWRGKPVVVTHCTSSSEGGNSKADIASASYEARDFGVKNGMWVGEARQLCPQLHVIPYDFDEYRRVSKTFFDTVSKITLDIEPNSVDEMVVDVTSVLNRFPGLTPQKLAEFIRNKIFEATKCPASIGIGSNRLLAKLATKRAKPNGIFHLSDSEAVLFIRNLDVGELPGIGWSMQRKLQEHFNVKTCQELSGIPLRDLKTKFGEKTAEKMMQFCNGKDTSDLKYGFDRPKSISVDVNYGIRFTSGDEVTDFVMKLCKELASRADRAQAKTNNLSVRILVRRKGAGEPQKHGGHGIVDALTKSSRFISSTNKWDEFYRSTDKVLRILAVPPLDYRGIGLTLTELHFEFDQQTTKGEKKSVQMTLLDSIASRGRKMLDSVIMTKPPISSTDKMNSNESLVRPCPPPVAPQEDSSLPPRSTEASDQVDFDVLRELPEDIRKEMLQHYGIDPSHLKNDELERKKSEIITSEPIACSSRNISTENSTSESETIVKTPSSVASATSNNPYDEVESIDPSFLCALPDSLRNEVLIQFKKAQEKKANEIPSNKNLLGSPQRQPSCSSSHQTAEQDRFLSCQENEDKQESGNAGTLKESKGSKNDSVEDKNVCDSETERNVTPEGKNALSDNKSGSRRRLNFEDEGESDPVYDGHVDPNETENDMVEGQRNGEPMKQTQTIIKARPMLNGALQVEDVREVLKNGFECLDDPSEVEIWNLNQYFVELAKGGWIRQTHALSKFLYRKLNRLDDNSPWVEIIQNILENIQTELQQQFGLNMPIE